MNEMLKSKFRLLYGEAIIEAEATIKNERIWELGYSGEEPNPHTDNINQLREYIQALEEKINELNGHTTIKVEYILNRGWVYNKNHDVIGEQNFIVPGKWLRDLYERKYIDKYESFENLLDTYDPDTDGEAIYRTAFSDRVLIKDTAYYHILNTN